MELDSIGISFFGHRWTQIVKILKSQNKNIVCIYLRKSTSYLTWIKRNRSRVKWFRSSVFTGLTKLLIRGLIKYLLAYERGQQRWISSKFSEITIWYGKWFCSWKLWYNRVKNIYIFSDFYFLISNFWFLIPDLWLLTPDPFK